LTNDEYITYKSSDKSNSNSNVYNLIISKNSKITKILDEPCVKFFEIFYKKTELDLTEYEINKKINLNDAKYFSEYLIKNFPNEDEYISKIEKVIKNYFIKEKKNYSILFLFDFYIYLPI